MAVDAVVHGMARHRIRFAALQQSLFASRSLLLITALFRRWSGIIGEGVPFASSPA